MNKIYIFVSQAEKIIRGEIICSDFLIKKKKKKM